MAARGCKNAPPDLGCRESAVSGVQLQLLPYRFLQLQVQACVKLYVVRTLFRVAVTKSFLLFESNPMRALFDLSTFLGIHHLLSHPIEFFQHDGLATHTGHERDHQRALLALVQSRSGFAIENASAADAAQSHIGFDHADYFELAEDVFHAVGRVWPDGSQPNEPDL